VTEMLPDAFVGASTAEPVYVPESSMRRHSRTAKIALALLFFGFFGVAAIVPIGGAVIGSGQLGVESQVKHVAHPIGGVISEIFVKEGSKVQAGQVLLRLDTSVSAVNADFSSQSLFQLLAERAVLEAQRDSLSSVRFPAELTGSSDPAAREAMNMAMRRFRLKADETTGIESQLAERERQLAQQIAGYNAQISSLEKQQVLLKPERDGVRELWKQDLVTINRLNQLERTAADLEGQIASLRASIAQTQARIAETREQSINVRQTARSQAATDLTRLLETLNQQQVQSVSASDQYERSVIRAPVTGVVNKLVVNVKGDVARPAEPILDVVPSNDRLVVDAAISPMDIDRVQRGQEARLRFSALNAQTTPEIPGKVIRVAPERTQDERSGMSYYRVRVEIDAAALAAEQLELKPGMPVEVYISTGERSMLSYMTKPLRDQFSRAFRD